MKHDMCALHLSVFTPICSLTLLHHLSLSSPPPLLVSSLFSLSLFLPSPLSSLSAFECLPCFLNLTQGCNCDWVDMKPSREHGHISVTHIETNKTNREKRESVCERERGDTQIHTCRYLSTPHRTAALSTRCPPLLPPPPPPPPSPLPPPLFLSPRQLMKTLHS